MTRGCRARTVLVGLAACAALGLTACSDSGYEYVSNGEAGLYFRVPDGWSVLEVDDAETGVPEPAGAVDSWLRLLDRSPRPGVENFNAPLPLYPVGVASVEQIQSLDARDQLDYATLRAMATNGIDDPLELASTADSGVQLISINDITTDEGLRGERVVFTMDQDDGSQLTVDQTAMVDPQTTEVYRLLLKCEAHCYESNRDEIDDIADSWTIDQED
jgi:hypothetical protein